MRLSIGRFDFEVNNLASISQISDFQSALRFAFVFIFGLNCLKDKLYQQ